MPDNLLYSDKLIDISDEYITLKNYYFPFLSSKKIPLQRIELIEAKVPVMANGKYRYWGSGDFRTWYPLDSRRSSRDKIFIIRFINKWCRDGFTAEDSEKVENILKLKKLIK